MVCQFVLLYCWLQENPKETTVFSKKLGQKAVPTRAAGRVVRDTTKQPRKLSLQEQMLADAQAAAAGGGAGESEQKSQAVDIRNIVPVRGSNKERGDATVARDVKAEKEEPSTSSSSSSSGKVRSLIEEID
jgi:hypothetical protein